MASIIESNFLSASFGFPTPAAFIIPGPWPLPVAPDCELPPDRVPYVTWDIGLDLLTEII